MYTECKDNVTNICIYYVFTMYAQYLYYVHWIQITHTITSTYLHSYIPISVCTCHITQYTVYTVLM